MKFRQQKQFLRPLALIGLTLLLALGFAAQSQAVQVTIADATGYGYNTAAYMDNGRYVGCGPTSGVMILDTYDNRLATPGDLVPDPLGTAWDLHYNYMNTGADGFGPTADMHFGLEDYTADMGHYLDAVVHVEPTTYDPNDWTAYSIGDDLATDATFWNTTTWDILDLAFLNFIKPEIDAGDPVMLTVDSDGNGGTDHWMVGVGYDLEAMMWAGYNTYDSTLHWYDVESAFIAGNTMGVGFVRTFDFVAGEGPITTPEPSTMMLLGLGLLGLAGMRRKILRR